MTLGGIVEQVGNGIAAATELAKAAPETIEDKLDRVIAATTRIEAVTDRMSALLDAVESSPLAKGLVAKQAKAEAKAARKGGLDDGGFLV